MTKPQDFTLGNRPPSSCIIISCSCRQSEHNISDEEMLITIKRRISSARPQKQSERAAYDDENRRFPRARRKH